MSRIVLTTGLLLLLLQGYVGGFEQDAAISDNERHRHDYRQGEKHGGRDRGTLLEFAEEGGKVNEGRQNYELLHPDSDDAMWNRTTRFPFGVLHTRPGKRHIHFLHQADDIQMGVEDGMMADLDLFATEFPLLQRSPWDYLNYDGHMEDIYDYTTGSAFTTMLSSMEENCTSAGNDSVICCTFAFHNSTEPATVCFNDTIQVPERKSICQKRTWEPFLKLICIPIICAFGICGNTISFLVMCSGAYRRKSYGYYLRALAVFDNLTLIINLVFALNDAVFHLKGRDSTAAGVEYSGLMSYHTNVTCKLTEFMRYVVYLMSSWLVVCFTVDRFIAVCFPLLRVRYCTEKSAIYTIAGVLAAIMVSQSYHLVYVERLERLQNPHVPCHAPMNVRLTYLGLNYFWFSFLLRFALPFLTVAFCNGCIIYHIERMKAGRHHVESRRKQKANLAIYTLYAVCACFVVTLLPNAIVTIIQFVEYMRHQQNNERLYCVLQLVYTPFHVLRLVNYAANCVLYGLTGQQFRRELFKLLGCCFRGQLTDKRSIQSPEPIPLTSRKNFNVNALLRPNR